jgi:hypothetical protein
MMKVTTAEEFKRQFHRKGFRSEVMDTYAHNLRFANAAWFQLADDTSECLSAIAVKHMETQRGRIGDKNILATLMLLRSLGLLQGTIMMLERGMVIEARTLMRSLLETSFLLGAIHDNAEAFSKQFIEDANAAQKAQAGLAVKYGSLDQNSPQYKATMATIDRLTGKFSALQVGEIAQNGPLKPSYLLYRVMSNDSAHTSLTSILHHFNFEAAKKGEGSFMYGPEGPDSVAANLDNLVLIATGIGVGFTNITGDGEGNREVAVLCDRFGKLSGR